MRYLNQVLLVFLCLIFWGCKGEPAPSEPDTIPVQISVNTSQQFQTIEGFGGFGAKEVWWSQGPFYDAAFIDRMINNLGITILRDNIPISFEPVNDNNDPELLALDQFNISMDASGADSHLGQHFPYLKAMHDAGLEKLIASIWSPPIWMKHNDHRGNGTNDQNSAPEYTLSPDQNTNQLKLENYEEFAEYCVAYIKLLKQETGIDLYAISLQNEPRFSQFYASCVHSPESLRDLIKVVGARFEKEGIMTKIFAPEDVQSMWHIRQYLDAILQDSLANRYTDIFAIHNYRDNGIDPSDEGPQNWQETYNKALQENKSVWMSETSGFDGSSMRGGLELAKSMYNALHFGNATAWVYWQMSESSDQGFLSNGRPNDLYFISQQFYRYIRPGAIRVSVTDDEDDILSLAFTDPALNTETLILINTGANHYEVTMTGDFADQKFQGYLTSSTEKHIPAGEIEKVIDLPPLSILTLSR